VKIDKAGRDFIYKHEGVRLKAYLDSVNVPTIGVGMTYYPGTGKKVQIGDVISLAQCDSMFTAIVASYEAAVTKAITVSITQSQFNALVSMAYNIGTAGFSKSTLVKRINASSSADLIKAAFLMWNKSGGKVNSTLSKRRNDEANLFLNQ
jgi:lysozyme